MNDEELIKKAELFARKAHAHQKRKYSEEMYFVHCNQVAHLVRIRGGSAEQIAAAYLHDTVEDTGTTLETIHEEFGYRVASLVSDLTHEYTKEKYPHLTRPQRKRRESIRLGQISEDAKFIKYCDMEDNMKDILFNDKGFAVIYLREIADNIEEMIVKR